MKRILAILMCVAMLAVLCFSMTACGGEMPDKVKDNGVSSESSGTADSSPSQTPDSSTSQVTESTSSVTLTDEEMIIGSWTGKMSVSDDYLSELIGEDAGEMSEYFDLNKLLDVDFTLTFKDDGTYISVITDEAAEKYVDNLIDILCDGMIEYVKDLAEANGTSWEEYLDAAGMTEQEFKDAILAEVDREELLKEMRDEIEPEAEYYKLENGKLYTSEDKDFKGDDVEVSDYELTATTLKMSFKDGVKATFTKVK